MESKEEGFRPLNRSMADDTTIQSRYNNTKWCILRYPNHAIAQQANMSTEDFEDLYFNVCNLDYSKMDRAMDNSIELMEQTDKVKIIGEGTELTFSIKGMPCIKDSGIMNLPDGEVYTMPVKDSVNGVISYNTPSLKEGYIRHATGNDSERINKLLNTDQRDICTKYEFCETDAKKRPPQHDFHLDS